MSQLCYAVQLCICIEAFISDDAVPFWVSSKQQPAALCGQLSCAWELSLPLLLCSERCPVHISQLHCLVEPVHHVHEDCGSFFSRCALWGSSMEQPIALCVTYLQAYGLQVMLTLCPTRHAAFCKPSGQQYQLKCLGIL